MQLIKDNFDPDILESFFITHLNRIYCAKLHLAKRLPEIENAANFSDLQNAIVETISEVEKQIARMHEIYELLNAEISIESHKGLTGLIEDAFIAIQQQSKDPILRDMSILFYMQNIESVEMTSFQVLQVAAIKLKNDEIKNLLQENFEAAKTSRSLLMLITAKYIAGKMPGNQFLR
jgi:ferritin-like metal-binding protein YciE